MNTSEGAIGNRTKISKKRKPKVLTSIFSKIRCYLGRKHKLFSASALFVRLCLNQAAPFIKLLNMQRSRSQ